jgi:hypothetical protein
MKTTSNENFRGILSGITEVPHVGPVLNQKPPADHWKCDLCERWMLPTPEWVTGYCYTFCPTCHQETKS